MSDTIEATFIYVDGTARTLPLRADRSLAEAGIAAGVSGIRSDCGFALSCATCHVYVAEEWLDRLPEMSQDEDDMLEGTASPRRDNSRLSCQIPLGPELDGLTVEIPKKQ